MKRLSTLLNISLVLSLLVVIACKQDKKNAKVEDPKEVVETDQTQMKKVMDIHDEVMPKMRLLGQMTQKLQPEADSTTTRGREALSIIGDLKDAYDSMNNWMVGFGNRFTPDEILDGAELSSEKKEWLKEEEVKVKVVRDKINGSLEKAEAFLGA
jgi:hypothetical protein